MYDVEQNFEKAPRPETPLHSKLYEPGPDGIVVYEPRNKEAYRRARYETGFYLSEEQVSELNGIIRIVREYEEARIAAFRKRDPKTEVPTLRVGALLGGETNGADHHRKTRAYLIAGELSGAIDQNVTGIMEDGVTSHPLDVLVVSPMMADLDHRESIRNRLRFLKPDAMVLWDEQGTIRLMDKDETIDDLRHKDEAIDDLLIAEWIQNRREQFPDEADPCIGVLVPAIATESDVRHSKGRLERIARVGISIEVVREDHLPPDNKWYDYLIEAGTYNCDGDDNSVLSAIRFLKHDGLVVDLVNGRVRNKTEAINQLRSHIKEYPPPAPIVHKAKVLPFPVRTRAKQHKKSA